MKTTKTTTLLTCALTTGAILSIVATGCRSRDSGARLPDRPPASRAVAELAPASNSGVRGAVYFSQENTGVRVSGVIIGLTPGDHGMHVHQNGDCSAPDASSAGDHFNPTGTTHGGPDSSPRHAGDLGNITADSAGTARFSKVFSFLNFQGPATFLGKALIVHEKADDLKSQPGGKAGARVACGVIRPE